MQCPACGPMAYSVRSPEYRILRYYVCVRSFFLQYILGSTNRVENIIISFDSDWTTRSHAARPLYLCWLFTTFRAVCIHPTCGTQTHFLCHAKNDLGKRRFQRTVQIIKLLIVLVVCFKFLYPVHRSNTRSMCGARFVCTRNVLCVVVTDECNRNSEQIR